MNGLIKTTVIAVKLGHIQETGIKKLMADRSRLVMHYTKKLSEAVDALKTQERPILLLPDTVVKKEGPGCFALIKRHLPAVKIIMYTTPLIERPEQYLAKGADGLVSKEAEFNELAKVCYALAAGESASCCTEMGLLINGYTKQREAGRLLTPTQEEVLLMYMNGMKREAIASKKNLAPNTISDYRNDAYAMLARHGITALDYIIKYKLWDTSTHS